MNARVDDPRAAKRRRLNIVDDNRTKTAPPPLYLSPNGFDTPITEPERSNKIGTKSANGRELVASPSTSAGHDSLSKAEQETPECCYGMVRSKPTYLQPNPQSDKRLSFCTVV